MYLVLHIQIESDLWKKQILQKLTFRKKKLIQNLTYCKSFNSKSRFLRKPEKGKMCRFHGVKWSKTWLFKSKYSFKTWRLLNFYFKFSLVLFFLVQNLSRFNFFNSYSNVLDFFKFKIRRILKKMR